MIARAFVADCPILLLDEPLANLDIAATLHLLELLKAQARKTTTICASFHDIALARQHADHVIVLDRGEIAAQGPTQKILTGPLLSKVFRVRAEIIRMTDNQEAICFKIP